MELGLVALGKLALETAWLNIFLFGTLFAFSGLCQRRLLVAVVVVVFHSYYLAAGLIVQVDTIPKTLRDYRWVNKGTSALFTFSLSGIGSDGEMIHPKSGDKESELRDIFLDS